MFKRVEEVTDKQGQVYEMILNHLCDNGYQPSLTDIAKQLGVTVKAITDRVNQLATKGLVSVLGNRNRCVILHGVKLLPQFENKDMIADLSEEEAEAYVALVDSVTTNCFQASMEELGEELGIAGVNVRKRIHRLAKKGYVTLGEKFSDRSIKLNHVRFEAKTNDG